MVKDERGASLLGGASTVVLVATSGLAWAVGQKKLFGIAWIAFLSMAVAGWVGDRTPRENASALVWGYGLASGAMVTSAAVFLLPQAIGQHATYGGFGVALGLLVGFGAHTLGHRLAHMDLPLDRTLAELTIHAVTAGVSSASSMAICLNWDWCSGLPSSRIRGRRGTRQ